MHFDPQKLDALFAALQRQIAAGKCDDELQRLSDLALQLFLITNERQAALSWPNNLGNTK